MEKIQAVVAGSPSSRRRVSPGRGVRARMAVRSCGVSGGSSGESLGVTWSLGRHREGCAGGHKFEIEYLASPVATSSNPNPSHRASKPVAMIVDPNLYLLQ